ncbi:unnamed protein product [Psylliodes chrysocephalus]|uniref:Uncharacterized protein n=1 Tax=Psylliodes chrysocephalus TaxID=3402493 RepID=A0A9P0D9P2_9CUCU|nr:unnamed protein product [Psylliodes chrysocephala]
MWKICLERGCTFKKRVTGLLFRTVSKNSSSHKVIGRLPYKALFGADPKAGFSPLNLPRDLLDNLENEDNLRMLEQHIENENLQEKSQCDEIEELHGIGESVGDHNDVEHVVHLIAEYQEEIKTLVITNENTEEIFSQEEVTLCITCPKDGGKCILCQNTAIIEENRHDTSRCQKRAAEKMLENTTKKLLPINIGSCVLLPIN